MSLVDALSTPDAFPVASASPVRLEQTHISWVFVLDHDVFKVKRPVDLGFLDFRTIDQRRLACEAEVTLNSRLSPQVYRGVVPIRMGANGRICVRGEGTVVDYAVHMVRLSDEKRADNLLTRNDLSLDAVDAMAICIARFHADARCDAATARFGTPEAIAKNVAENFAQTKTAIDSYLQPEEARAIVQSQTEFVETHAASFDRRASERRVRDGHGDLRLEHVYVDPHGAPTIIDCIEFSDRFRYADVCADIAFLSMDFAAHRRVDLAERLLARYAREADDFGLYELVDFYEGYRAFVRGKVATIVAADTDAPAPAREKAAEEARRSFLLALSTGRRSLLAPSVTAVGGIIASGKSTVAARLGDALGAPVIDADRTRKAMLHVEPTKRIDDAAWSGAYDPAVTDRVYAELLERAAIVVASGRPVVLDASFRSRKMRESARAFAAKHGVPFRFVECRATVDACRARLERRSQETGVSDGRLEIFDAFCGRFEPIDELAASDHIVVDTACPLAESLAMLRTRIPAWPRGFVA